MKGGGAKREDLSNRETKHPVGREADKASQVQVPSRDAEECEQIKQNGQDI